MPKTKKPSKSNYAFVDASNLFYGGVKSLGWKIDYKKLIHYIKTQYKVKKVFYYGGVELNGFPFNMFEEKKIDLKKLILHLKKITKNKKLNKNSLIEVIKKIQRVKFYVKLEEFGYILKLKPVKFFREENGRISKKANCDVDMTFDLMRLYNDYKGVLILSGDGDFTVVLKYLKETGKDIKILARGERTAREIKQLAGGNFRDFNYLREILKFKDQKKRRHI
ncbi:MAG: NYN domain-containing protein [bacterium]|nr:NYN domain-containing protein [bacterium]